MEFPTRIRRLRLLTVITAIYGLMWIAMEGELYRSIIMAFLTTSVVFALLAQRFAGGRAFSFTQWLLLFGSLGLFFGICVALLTLLFMGVKTGLHGHGPEFTQDQISRVMGQIPLWGVVGPVAGVGVGLITASLGRKVD
jgi:hypothetical protein